LHKYYKEILKNSLNNSFFIAIKKNLVNKLYKFKNEETKLQGDYP